PGASAWYASRRRVNTSTWLMPSPRKVYSSMAPPRRGLTTPENAAEWTQISSNPSPSRSSCSNVIASSRRSSRSATARLCHTARRRCGRYSPPNTPCQSASLHCARPIARRAAARHLGKGGGKSSQPDLAPCDQRAHRLQELGEPAAVIHPFLRAGPAAEFLAVVRQHGQGLARVAQLAQVRHRVGRGLERDQVA